MLGNHFTLLLSFADRMIKDLLRKIGYQHFQKHLDKRGMVGDLGIEPSVRLREGVTVPCHTLRPVALRYVNIPNEGLNRRSEHVRQYQKTTK